MRSSAAEFLVSSAIVLWLLSVLSFSGTVFAAPAAPERSPVRLHSYALPMTFEVNQGQTDRRVDFLARGENYTLFLTPTEAVFALPDESVPKAQGSHLSVMRMQLIDSARDARVQGLEELPGKVNYLRGNDSTQWRTVRTYQTVKYTGVYPGIDLVYYGKPQQLEYDFIVAPGADPTAITLAFAGVNDASVDVSGDLLLKATGGQVRDRKSVV